MSIMIGTCNSCNRDNVEIFEDNQCIICKRLDNIEKTVTDLMVYKKNYKKLSDN